MSDDLKSQITSLLSSSSPSSTSPADLASSLNTLLSSQPPSSSEDKSWPTGTLYSTLLTHIASLPPSSPSIPLLASALAHLPKTDDLGMCVRSTWNGSVKAHGVEGWTSLNAFVALLSSSKVSDFDLYAIWALRSALEGPSLSSATEHVPAAAAWITHAGTRIYELSKEGVRKEEWARAARGGEAWEGEDGFGLERWAFWKGQFEKGGTDEGTEAAKAMGDIESKAT